MTGASWYIIMIKESRKDGTEKMEDGDIKRYKKTMHNGQGRGDIGEHD